MKAKPLARSGRRPNSITEILLLLAFIAAGSFGTVTVRAQSFALSISREAPREISFVAQKDFEYRLEASAVLNQPNWEIVAEHLTGDGTVLNVSDAAVEGPRRFYRAVRMPFAGGTISPNAILPVPKVVYPEKTLIGSPVLGLQYAVPRNWKGGLRENTSTMLFGSDTEPGLVLTFISLAGEASSIAQVLGLDFYVSQFGGFQISKPPQTSGRTILIEWLGAGFDEQGNSLGGVTLQVRAVVHPSGGSVGFAGFFTEPNRKIMERVLDDFATSTLTVARRTRMDLVTAISGKSFVWVKSTSVGNGGNSGSLSSWKQNNAFFCPATYEITTYSESSYGGNLSGGGFYSGGSSNRSTEAGDWTVIDTDSGPVLVMISSEGGNAALISIKGNSIFFGDQQFDYSGPHNCN